MKEWFRSLPKTIADHVVKTILGILVAALILGLIGNQAGVVGGGTAENKPARNNSSKESASTDSWPDGESAWTVILASEQTRGAAEAAVDRARRIPDRGLSLGILNSDDYVSLRGGYWVAFAGQFASVEEAQEAANRYRSEFPTTYQRFIEER